MSFRTFLKLVIFILHSQLSANIILGGQYELDLTVKDPDEKYPVSIKLNISDNSKVTSAKFVYPTYDCDSVLKKSTTNKNQITIFETMNQNECENTSYIFYFSHNNTSNIHTKDIEKIYNIYQNQQIKTTINKTKFTPTKLSKLRIKYNISKWQDIKNLLQQIKTNPTKEILKNYIFLFTNFPKEKKGIIKEAEEEIFKIAKKLNTFDMYDKFLNVFPYSRYENQFFLLKDILVFDDIKQTHTIESYKLYISKHSKGAFLKEAKLQIENINKEKKDEKKSLKK